MARQRAYAEYNDGCASAHALDLVGERWTLVIVRELLLGPKRFSDIERDVLGAGPTVLTKRLQDLVDRGIAVRRELPPPAAGTVYDLTDWGRQLEAVNAALSAWAIQSPSLPWAAEMSPDTLVLAMRAHLRTPPADSPIHTVCLELTDSRRPDDQRIHRYHASIAPAAVQIERSVSPGAVEATVTASSRAWKSVVIGGLAPLTVPELRVDGALPAVRALIEATRLRH